ncbi:MAG: acyltransferase family protein [Muribaculaceae bacterium]
MSTTDTERSRENCFTLLRYLFFFCIFCNHFFLINGNENTLFNGLYLVQGFFIISGVLVFNSYERSCSIREFFLKRFLRIYPAYFIAVVCGFIMGIILTTMPIIDFLSCKTTWKYLLCNLAFGNFLQPTLPGVFENNPLPYINSSLWTLKVEIMFYLSVPIVAYLIKRYNKNIVLFLIIIFSITWDICTSQLYYFTEKKIFYDLNHQIFGELSFFYFPVLLYNHRTVVLRKWWIFALALIILPVQTYVLGINYFNCLLLPTILLFIAYKASFLFKLSRVTDYSYEMYLARFPILQTLCLIGMPYNATTFVVSLIIIFFIAYYLHSICAKISYKNLFEDGKLRPHIKNMLIRKQYVK